MPRTHVFYLAPTSPGVGLTSVGLGLVHALDRLGVRVAFLKPVSQPGAAAPDRSTHFVRQVTDLEPPEPLPFAEAEEFLRRGAEPLLLEQVVGRFQQASAEADIVVVEGVADVGDAVSVDRLNAAMVRALDAQVIMVGAPGNDSPAAFCQRLQLSGERYGGPAGPRLLGCVVNRLGAPHEVMGANRSLTEPGDPETELQALRQGCSLLNEPGFRLLGAVPWRRELTSPRLGDVAGQFGARVLSEGELRTRRVVDVSLVARTVANMTGRLRPGALIITPVDRDDIILAACMAELNGVPLAGLLLTGGTEPNETIMDLCRPAFDAGLPVLAVPTDSYVTAAHAARLNVEVALDDTERMTAVMETVAGNLDAEWLRDHALADSAPRRLSPAAFMYRLVTRAAAADRRIILPEGTEPRTVRAAISCAERGIARCVLLGPPAEITRLAEAQGLGVPPGVELLDPEPLRERYVPHLLEMRRHRGMTEDVARDQLADDIVLGTVMLARGEVDGLVAGAVNTTANTLRPALQLIRTAPGTRLVSSVFFMCLPDQVLVYGDCAVNPDPDAEELADIAVRSAESAELFGIDPVVAMISYSTGASGAGADVDKVREATRIARELRPDLPIDGPLQYDAALTESVARSKAPDSTVAGRATVLIFPDLNTGNTTYKAVQRSAGVVSIGPMLQGLKKPVNDLSRGALVDDIIYTIALTAIQADRDAALAG